MEVGGLFDEVQNMARLRQIELCAGVLNDGNNTSIVANSVFNQHLQNFIIFPSSAHLIQKLFIQLVNKRK